MKRGKPQRAPTREAPRGRPKLPEEERTPRLDPAKAGHATTRQRKRDTARALRTQVVGQPYFMEVDEESDLVQLRRAARLDYITAHGKVTIKSVYLRADRPYQARVSESAFLGWAVSDQWASERQAYWNEIERRTLMDLIEHNAAHQAEQLKFTQDLSTNARKYMEAKRHPDGTVMVHPPGHADAGLPVFPRGIDWTLKQVPAVERLMKLVDSREGITRAVTNALQSVTGSSTPGVVGKTPNVSAQEASALAQELIKLRHSTMLASPAVATIMSGDNDLQDPDDLE